MAICKRSHAGLDVICVPQWVSWSPTTLDEIVCRLPVLFDEGKLDFDCSELVLRLQCKHIANYFKD